MIFGLYAIKDAKSSFMPCTVDTNDATAIRNFEHAVAQPASLLASHPNDFALFKLGHFCHYKDLLKDLSLLLSLSSWTCINS